MRRNIDKNDMEALLYGSIILGGGGGGSLKGGQSTIEAAFEIGNPTIIDVEDLIGKDGVVVTTSAVGAPAAKDQFVKAEDYNRIIELFEREFNEKPIAFITNEMGAGSTFNAFIQSAKTGIPMVDAACNGRAHPLGTMGSMGLSENKDYEAIQTAVGGNPELGNYVEITVKGSVAKTSALIRNAAVQAGGLVVVARNPVTIDYVKDNSAIGAISQAIKVGEAYLAGKTPEEKISNVTSLLNGQVVCKGKIENFVLNTENGLDLGSFEVNSNNNYKMHIWNEYMALEENNERIYSFPDLMMTFDAETALPLTSAELEEGKEIVIIGVPYNNLNLGAGMFEKSGYEAIENVTGLKMLPYVSNLINRDNK